LPVTLHLGTAGDVACPYAVWERGGRERKRVPPKGIVWILRYIGLALLSYKHLPAAQKSFLTDVVDRVRLVRSLSAARPPNIMTTHIAANVKQHSKPFCDRK